MPDHEVFEYSAETGQLVCVSCDPSGARPLGSAFIGAKLGERASTPFHQPRSLSDDGSRVFFSSPDPLVPGLAGGSPKVFEYEGGSVRLISGAEAGGVSVFLDASASGDDVFLATRERLAPSDEDELVDVYDARVDGGFPSPPAVAACSGSTCREPLAQPPAFSAPASASLLGVGNLPPPRAREADTQATARAGACEVSNAEESRAAKEAAWPTPGVAHAQDPPSGEGPSALRSAVSPPCSLRGVSVRARRRDPRLRRCSRSLSPALGARARAGERGERGTALEPRVRVRADHVRGPGDRRVRADRAPGRRCADGAATAG